jgi:hypothetical protein
LGDERTALFALFSIRSALAIQDPIANSRRSLNASNSMPLTARDHPELISKSERTPERDKRKRQYINMLGDGLAETEGFEPSIELYNPITV